MEHKSWLESVIKQCYQNQTVNSIARDISIILISGLVLILSVLDVVNVISLKHLDGIYLFHIGIIFHLFAIISVVASFDICNIVHYVGLSKYYESYFNNKPIPTSFDNWDIIAKWNNITSTILFFVGFILISIFFLINI